MAHTISSSSRACVIVVRECRRLPPPFPLQIKSAIRQPDVAVRDAQLFIPLLRECLSLSLSFTLSLSVPSSRRKSETTTARYLREFEWHGNYSAVSWHTHMHMAKQSRYGNRKWISTLYVYVCMSVRIVAVSIRNGNWKFKSCKDVNCKRSVKAPFGLLTRN